MKVDPRNPKPISTPLYNLAPGDAFVLPGDYGSEDVSLRMLCSSSICATDSDEVPIVVVPSGDIKTLKKLTHVIEMPDVKVVLG